MIYKYLQQIKKKLKMKLLLIATFMVISFFESPKVLAASLYPKSSVEKIINEPHYFFLLMNDGCFHLVRINPPGFIDPLNGTFFDTWSMTVMTNSTYAGTVLICPTGGTVYC
jgi:hypothetical protein